MNSSQEMASKLDQEESKEPLSTLTKNKLFDSYGIENEITNLENLGQLKGNDLLVLNYIDNILQSINKKLEVY